MPPPINHDHPSLPKSGQRPQLFAAAFGPSRSPAQKKRDGRAQLSRAAAHHRRKGAPPARLGSGALFPQDPAAPQGGRGVGGTAAQPRPTRDALGDLPAPPSAPV